MATSSAWKKRIGAGLTAPLRLPAFCPLLSLSLVPGSAPGTTLPVFSGPVFSGSENHAREASIQACDQSSNVRNEVRQMDSRDIAHAMEGAEPWRPSGRIGTPTITRFRDP
jgi:hypothetical protein